MGKFFQDLAHLQELTHLQKLAHSNLAGVGWGGVGWGGVGVGVCVALTSLILVVICIC